MDRIHLVLFFLLLSIPLASAIKISGRQRIDFEPGRTYNGTVCIAPGDTTVIELEPTGGIAEYIDVAEERVNITESQGCVPYTVAMPDEFDTPGLHKGGITATELPQGTSENIIAARVRITHQIWIEVPYPGMYIQPSVSASNTAKGNDVPLQVTLTNKGNETVNDADGTITVLRNQTTVDTIPLTVNRIEPEEETQLSALWNSSGASIGRYHADLHVSYAEKTATGSDTFKLGTEEIRLVNTTNAIPNDGIVPFHTMVESFWSNTIKDVHVTGTVVTDTGDNVGFETKRHDISAWKTKQLTAYIDTKQLSTGDYDMTLTVHYPEEDKTFERQVSVVESASTERPTSGTSIYLYATIALGIIVLVLAGYVLRQD